MTINCMLSHQYYWTLGYAWSVQGWTNTLMLFYTITFLATSFLSYYFGSQSLSHSSDFRKPIPTPFSLSSISDSVCFLQFSCMQLLSPPAPSPPPPLLPVVQSKMHLSDTHTVNTEEYSTNMSTNIVC